MSDEVEDFLAHYGVKGMKWGVRKKYHEHKVRKLTRRLKVSKDHVNMIDDSIKIWKQEVKDGRDPKGAQNDIDSVTLDREYEIKRQKVMTKGRQKSLSILAEKTPGKSTTKTLKEITAKGNSKIPTGQIATAAVLAGVGVALWRM